jgi:hypothetical protein
MNFDVTPDMRKQYNAVGFIGDPFVIVKSPVTYDPYIKIEACLVGETADGIIVSFRGTLPPTPTIDSIADWIENIFYAKTVTNQYLSGDVHEGFLKAFLTMQDDIKQALDTFSAKNKPLYITGHSKGGALAPIAAMYLKNRYDYNITNVITFAGPKPGNAHFALHYNSLVPESTNYENYLDIVPLLPPSKLTIEVLSHMLPKSWTTLQKVLREAEGWDYEPVSKVLFVTKDSGITEPTLILDVKRLVELGETLLTDPKLIGDAHHVSCNFRYMKAICKGTVCGN